MQVKIEKAANGYIIELLILHQVLQVSSERNKYVFGNLQSAFRWLEEKFGETDTKETQGTTASEPPAYPPVPNKIT